MKADAGTPLARLAVDGGMTADNVLVQTVAGVLDVPVVRPTLTGTSHGGRRTPPASVPASGRTGGRGRRRDHRLSPRPARRPQRWAATGRNPGFPHSSPARDHIAKRRRRAGLWASARALMLPWLVCRYFPLITSGGLP